MNMLHVCPCLIGGYDVWIKVRVKVKVRNKAKIRVSIPGLSGGTMYGSLHMIMLPSNS